jgi:transposase
MKNITEILGGAQLLLDVSFDLQDVFEEYLSEEQRAFLVLLRLIEEDVPMRTRLYGGRGRIPYDDQPFFRAAIGKSFLQIVTTDKLIDRLHADANFKRICGFPCVPSAATFSRRFATFAEIAIMDQTLNTMVRRHLDGRLIGHILRDSTAIEAREKAQNKKGDLELSPKPVRRRGRPRKGEPKAAKRMKRLATQARQKASVSVAQLDRNCAWGCKKNSQGNVTFWKGYKLHLDVTEMGIPVTAVVTGANVHDSQVAIPMEKLTERKIDHLYSLMDSAYDAQDIRSYIQGKGRVAIIDGNKRRGEGARPLDAAEKQRFKIRSTVERANSHLKDWLIGGKVYVRGIRKVRFHLLSGVVCLAAVKILQYLVIPQQDAEAA